MQVKKKQEVKSVEAKIRRLELKIRSTSEIKLFLCFMCVEKFLFVTCLLDCSVP